ncbi:MAG: hypothetical protein WAK17_01645, partial [Candidatus Nitrosopolaris sp.]
MSCSTISNYIKNFPFVTLREKQSYVLNEIDVAFASGYRYIILEAPTGFGKSPVAIAAALTLGSSYICTSTKDLQTQYARDFPFVRVAKGKNNFTCEVKDDLIGNGTYRCKSCGPYISRKGGECHHTTVEYGPCMGDKDFGCEYKTRLKDYQVIGKGTKQEQVFLSNEERYQNKYSEWIHLNNLKENAIREWRPCKYFDQLNIALAASHSVLNYAIFLAFLNKNLPSRDLLILDEAHLLETEVVKFRGISISKKKWKKYIPDLKVENHGYDIRGWVDFLVRLKQTMSLFVNMLNEELLVEATQDIDKLDLAIDSIVSNATNWIVSEVKKEDREVARIELKPLDVSPYCKDVFTNCNKTLLMSATILDIETFCSSVGLPYDNVKVIRVGSDFPLKNRPIYPLATAYLNYESLHNEEVKMAIAKNVDTIMIHHKDDKGIIHTTSYEQLNFIRENVSEANRRRLLVTDP